MGIISKMRKQNAIYWPPAVANGYGRPGVSVLVPLTLLAGVNSRVRWEGRVEEFIDAKGTTMLSQAVVYVPVLPGGGEVQPGGWLWLGDQGNLVSEVDPRANPGAYFVHRFDTLPTLKATQTLRTAYL